MAENLLNQNGATMYYSKISQNEVRLISDAFLSKLNVHIFFYWLAKKYNFIEKQMCKVCILL